MHVFGLQMACCLFLALRLKFLSFFIYRFRIFAPIESAALRPFVLRYACSYLTTVCVFFFLLLYYFYGDIALSECFLPLPFPFCMERTCCTFSLPTMFSERVTTGRILTSAYHINCQFFHDGIRACVRLDDRVCSGWFAVEHGLCQGCVLVPLLFNIFFSVVINVASMRHERFGTTEEEKGARGRGGATAGESVLATPLWGMLYADDARVVSQSPEKLSKMVGVIVVGCAAFCLTLSEAQD